MFSLRICIYSLGDLIIEVLQVVKIVKFIEIKGIREARGRGFDETICPGGRDLTNFKNCAWVAPGRGG